MSKKELKKEVKRLNKIIDVLLKENRGVTASVPNRVLSTETSFENGGYGVIGNITTTNDYLGGRPNDRKP